LKRNAIDVREAKFVRIRISDAESNCFLALCETVEDRPKRINYVIGGWDNSKSGPFWFEKDKGIFEPYDGDEHGEHMRHGRIFDGNPKWFELNWSLED